MSGIDSSQFALNWKLAAALAAAPAFIRSQTWREGWSALCGSFYFFEEMAPHFLQILGRFWTQILHIRTQSIPTSLLPFVNLKSCAQLCSYIDNWKRPLEVASSILCCPKLGEVPIPKSFENPPLSTVVLSTG